MKALSFKKISFRRIPKLLGYSLAIVFALLLVVLVYHFFFAFKPLMLQKGKELQARIIVAPKVYHIGDIIPVTLEVEARDGVIFNMPDLATMDLGPLEMVSKSKLVMEKPYGGIRKKIIYQFTAWEAGKCQLKGFNLTFYRKIGIQKSYPIRNCFVNIQSLLPAGKSEQQLTALKIKNSKPPVGMPPQYFILWWVLGILAGCVLIWLIAQYLQRSGNRKEPLSETETRHAPQPEAAHVIALRRLETIRNKDYLSMQAYKPYYTELAECIREYLENRFHIKALEMTTEEFLEELTTGRTLGKAHQQILIDFLQSADLVKFAKCLPLPGEAEKALTLAGQLIEETKESPSADETSTTGVNLSSQEN
jgi:hypothetical protein